MKRTIKKILGLNVNEERRDQWLKQILAVIPSGARILDAGAGQLRNRPLCSHLTYVSQDICEYDGKGESNGLHTGLWDTRGIDIVSDIATIPEPDQSFDAILCSEVFEHLPNPLEAVKEFQRLLRPGGVLIVTAPFASLVHFAPYHYSTGFSRYWYEYHLPRHHFKVESLESNGDWFSFCRQELLRLPSISRKYGDWCWPLSFVAAAVGFIFFSLRSNKKVSDDLASFGWHCVARKID